MAYSKIFVALAHTEGDSALVAQGLDLARQNQSQLMFFHCIPLENTAVTTYPSFYGENALTFAQALQTHLAHQEEDVTAWLQTLGTQAQNEGVVCEWDWTVGEPGRWIQEKATAWGADLVVVGRRGLRGIAEMVLGSVSSYLIHRLPCSVLVVQHGP